MERPSTSAVTLESLQDATSKTHEQGYHGAIKLTTHTIGYCQNFIKKLVIRTFLSDKCPTFTHSLCLISAKMASDLKTDSPPDLSDEAGTIDTEPPVNEKSLLRKLDAKLLPAVGVLYLLSFLDRSNGKAWTGLRPRQVDTDIVNSRKRPDRGNGR